MRSISLLGPIMPFLLFSNGIEHEQSQRRREGLGSYIYKMKIWVERAVERRRRRRRRIEKESLYLKVWTSKKAKDGHRNASNRSNQIHTNSSRTCPIHIGFWSNWIGITRDYGWNSLLCFSALQHAHAPVVYAFCFLLMLLCIIIILSLFFPLMVLFVRESRNLKGCWNVNKMWSIQHGMK